MANDIGGVWRTIGGRRVFIKDGQDLASAMKESGKFKSKKDIEHQQRKINNELMGLTGKDKQIADEEYDAYEKLKNSQNNKPGEWIKENISQDTINEVQKGLKDMGEKLNKGKSELDKEKETSKPGEWIKNNISQETIDKVGKDLGDTFNKLGIGKKDDDDFASVSKELQEIYNRTGKSDLFSEAGRRWNELYKQDKNNVSKDLGDKYYEGVSYSGRVTIQSTHPYDETEYSWAEKKGNNWQVHNPTNGKNENFNSRDEALKEMKIIDDYISTGDEMRSYEGVKSLTKPKISYEDFKKSREEEQMRNDFRKKYGERFGNKTDDMYDYISTGEVRKNTSSPKSMADAIKNNRMDYEDDGLGGTYSLGEWGKKGYYVQFQDRESHQHDDIMKYPNASARVKSYTWARIWKDGELVQNIEDSKYGARQKAIDYLQKQEGSNYMNNSIRNAYNDYKKKHPNSKMTFDAFKRNNK